MNRRALLLEMAAAVAPDQSLTVPAAWLTEALADPIELGDVGVPELCHRYGRRPSAIRAWLEAGKFPQAYRRQGREWRVPRAALALFDQQQRTPIRRSS